MTVGVDAQTPVTFTLEIGTVSRGSDGHRRIAAAARRTAPTSRPGSTPQLTDLPVLDRNFTKFILLTPGTQQLQWQHAASENPQGSTQTMVNGQHFSGTGLPARRHREPRSDSRHHRDQPDARIDRRNEDHVAELRCRVRPGHRGRRVGPDQVRHQRPARQRVRVLSERQVPGAQPVHAVPGRCADRPVRPRDRAQPVRGVDRRTPQAEPVVLLRRLSGHARHPGGLEVVDRADGGGARRQPERVRREHLRSGERPAVSRQRHPVGPAVGAGAGAARG